MAGFLFHEVVFGPVRSRRLGLSLGINLLPSHAKYCSFNCIYCECGWTPANTRLPQELPSREEVRWYLEKQLKQLTGEEYLPDAITFAGNGEPTIHPDFPSIVDDTIELRNILAPDARVTVLSNASMLHDEAVFQALLKLDHNIQKLDGGTERIFRLINNPVDPLSFGSLTENLRRFHGKVIIQTMFLRGHYRGEPVDNTTGEEVSAWLEKLVEIQPRSVMIYPLARATPVNTLEKISTFELEKIAEKVREAGLQVEVYQ
ncbi:MAG: radical SAM protein [Bacteroidetes bacterium]|nr:MAG: radical SAM protein [Bacteroidota bacterium]